MMDGIVDATGHLCSECGHPLLFHRPHPCHEPEAEMDEHVCSECSEHKGRPWICFYPWSTERKHA